MVYDVILGCDFLEFYKVKIDFEWYILVFKGDFSFFDEFDFEINKEYLELGLCMFSFYL